jgi:hypothetical protein
MEDHVGAPEEGSRSREEGSLDYDGGFVRLQIHMKFDTNIHRQHTWPIDFYEKDHKLSTNLTQLEHFAKRSSNSIIMIPRSLLFNKEIP